MNVYTHVLRMGLVGLALLGSISGRPARCKDCE